MKLRTGDKVEFKNEIATVLEHTDVKLVLLLGNIDDLNEIEVNVKEITLYAS